MVSVSLSGQRLGLRTCCHSEISLGHREVMALRGSCAESHAEVLESRRVLFDAVGASGVVAANDEVSSAGSCRHIHGRNPSCAICNERIIDHFSIGTTMPCMMIALRIAVGVPLI